MQLVKITLDRNTGAKMKRKHFTLLHMWLLFFVMHQIKKPKYYAKRQN